MVHLVQGQGHALLSDFFTHSQVTKDVRGTVNFQKENIFEHPEKISERNMLHLVQA